jgi:hypothetical protein
MSVSVHASRSIFDRNHALSKAKLTINKASVAKKELVIDPFLKLKNNLSRYTRSNDRRMMLRTIETSSLLAEIPLEGLPHFVKTPEQWLELEEEVCQTHVTINGVKLGGGKKMSNHRELFEVLEKLCEHLTRDIEMTTESLFQQLILRLAHSLASADAYFQLNAMLGSPDLILQVPKKGKSYPSDVQIYKSSHDQIHVIVQSSHPYGLFRKHEISSHSKRPWIRLTGTVYERVNLSTNESVRYCSIQVQDK